MANKHQIDVSAFDKAFVKALTSIARAEKVTKEQLKGLSRDILIAWHQTGNVAYANKTLAVLTPVNKKVFITFMKRFSGFSHDDVGGMFTSKSKKRYEEAHKMCMTALDDPHFNMWSWAERHIEVQETVFTVEAFKKTVNGAIKKAQARGISEVELLKGLFSGAFNTDSVIQALEEMEVVDVANKEEQPQG